MTFGQPDLLYFLLALPLLLGLRLWASRQAGQVVASMTAPRLRSQLLVGGSRWRAALAFFLQLAALAFFILAAAQPRWGEDRTVQKESGRNVIIAVDTSRSMLADDVAPDRLTRARLAAQDVLNSLRTDRVGLIAFAGNAYLQAPLTTDHEAVVEAIQSLDFTSVPRGGSDLGKALKLAVETFDKNPARNHGLILFSDGGEPDAEIRAYAEQAAKKNILVLTVGVGTEEGALIPDPDPDRAGEYVRDHQGNVVRTRLEGKVLEEVAALTRGRYLKLGSQPLAQSVVKDLLSALQAQANQAREIVKPVERFQWPLSIGVLLLMSAWFLRTSPPARRLAPAVAVLCVGFHMAFPVPTRAETPKDSVSLALFGLNNRKASPEEAERALKEGNHKLAIELFDRLLKDSPPEALRQRYSHAMGYAAHQEKDFDRAVSAFSRALETDEVPLQRQAHQGLAHSLYDQGDRALSKQPKFALRSWRDSLKHFDAALKLDPEDVNLKENREFVKKRLEELQEQMDQQAQQQNQKGQKGQKGDKQKGQKGEGEDGEGEDQSGDGDEDQDRSRKESLGKQEEGEQKGGELPEGELQAANKGEPSDEGEGKEAGEGNEADEKTGFTRNEARAFLRTYADDQKKAMLVRPRDPAPNGKDW